MKERDGVVIVPDFLPPETMEIYRDEISRLPRHNLPDQAHNKFIQIGDSEVLDTLKNGLNTEIKEFIEDYYSCVLGQEELASLVGAYPGWELSMHYDTNDGIVPTYAGYPSRDITSLLYFSNYGIDFTGGDLYILNQDLSIFPKAGTLVVFPASEKYVHRVSKVESGERLSMSSFWHVKERFDSTRYV